MKGDFSRNPLENGKGYSSVLMQQGRVLLDADWNKLGFIFNHYLRALAADLIGPHGGPASNAGFGIKICEGGKDFEIGFGHYYVDGILIENEPYAQCGVDAEPAPVTYYTQQYYADCCDHDTLGDAPFLVYLDVWERHITYIQDPDIREVALGGPDTTTRLQVVWQVKTLELEQEEELDCKDIPWDELIEAWQPTNRGCLKARTEKPQKATDLCITPPDAGYRGAENQLYRVEIHKAGEAGEATFEWSRDNGNIVFAIRSLQGDTAALEHMGRDAKQGLRVGDWVEIVDDYVLCGEPGLLVQIAAVDRVELTVALKVPDGVDLPVYDENSTKHPFLCRWDHKAGNPTQGEPQMADDGALLVEESKWLFLEDGVEIYFHSSPTKPHRYRTGDYWLIPARTATGDLIWPKQPDNYGNLVPVASPPHGVEHHFAPLAVVNAGADGRIEASIIDCRCTFPQLCTSATPLKVQRVAFYDHDFQHIRDLGDPGEVPELTGQNGDRVAAILVEFNKPVKSNTIIAGAEVGEDFKTFNFLVSKVGMKYVPGNISFEHDLIPFESGKGVLFTNNPHSIFKPGTYTVTLFGAKDGNRPAITAADGSPLIGNEDQNFKFGFVVVVIE